MPFTGSVFVSTYFAVFVAETVKTCDPFGFRSEIFIDAIVEFVMSSETRWPAVPLNVAVALSPEFEIVDGDGRPARRDRERDRSGATAEECGDEHCEKGSAEDSCGSAAAHRISR